MIIRRHALVLWLAMQSAVGRSDPVASTTSMRPGAAFNRTQPMANSSCQASCIYTVPSVSYNWWVPVSITETVTAETIITVINRKKNTTSLSTVSNPSWDPSKHPKPTDLNSDGTRTAVITDMAPFGTTSTTYTITFPTMYLKYPPTYTVRGQIPTTIDGKSTCASFSRYDGASFTWPSHPTIAPTAPIIDANRLEQDSRGWSWQFRNRDAFASDPYINASLPEEDRHPGQWWVKPFFPNLPLWDICSAGVDDTHPYAVEAKTALFLTGSSTAFEDGDDDDDDEERTSSPGSPAFSVATTPTAPSSVAAAPVLIPSPTDHTQGAKTAPSATPANTASDQLPLQTSQASRTALESSAIAMDNGLHVHSADVQAQPTHIDSAKAEGWAEGIFAAIPFGTPKQTLQKSVSSLAKSAVTTAASPHAQTLPAGSESEIVTGDSPAISSPSPNTVEHVLATPLVLLPSGQSLVLSLSGSQTTLAIQASNPTQSFQFAGQEIVVDSQGQYRVGSQTLTPNQALTLTEARTDVHKGGSSMSHNANAGGSGQTGPAFTTAPPALFVGSQTIQPDVKGNYISQSQTFTTNTAGQLIVGGATLAPGSAVTVSGTPISLSPQGQAGISGTSEQTGLGPAIMGGLGPGAPGGSNDTSVSGTAVGSPAAPVAFTGSARKIRKAMLCELATLVSAFLGIVHMV